MNPLAYLVNRVRCFVKIWLSCSGSLKYFCQNNSRCLQYAALFCHVEGMTFVQVNTPQNRSFFERDEECCTSSSILYDRLGIIFLPACRGGYWQHGHENVEESMIPRVRVHVDSFALA